MKTKTCQKCNCDSSCHLEMGRCLNCGNDCDIHAFSNFKILLVTVMQPCDKMGSSSLVALEVSDISLVPLFIIPDKKIVSVDSLEIPTLTSQNFGRRFGDYFE